MHIALEPWIWTAQIHLHADFFKNKYSSAGSAIGGMQGCGDEEGRLQVLWGFLTEQGNPTAMLLNYLLLPIGWLPRWLRNRICLQCRRSRFHPWVREIPWRREIMYQCERWTIKKTECQRIDTFELWYWRRLLRVPWTAGRSHQSILKEINHEYSLEGFVLKLKLQ